MKKNILANLVGKFWSIISIYLFIPLYIEFLGFDSYSIISFTLILASLMAIADSGIKATLSREFAISNTSNSTKISILSTLETLYYFIISIIVCVLILFSSNIASEWINYEGKDIANIPLLIKIVVVEFGLQMIFRLYLGGIIGLEKQVLSNLINISWGILRNGFVVLAIYYSPSLITFFSWQLLITLLFVIVSKVMILRELKSENYFLTGWNLNKKVFKKVWKFALGMFLISLVAGVNSQLDKISISKFLPIDTLGYYNLSMSISMGLVSIVSPIAVAILPRFTSLFSSNKNEEVKKIFYLINGIVVSIVFPLMATIVFFGEELILIWTGDITLAKNAYVFMPFLAFAYGMLSLAVIPYNIAISNGDTKLNNIIGLVSLVFTIPAYYFGTRIYGAIGAAIIFAFVQLCITLTFYYFINKKYLNSDFAKLIVRYILTPISISLLLMYLVSFSECINGSNRLVLLLQISISLILVTSIVSVITIGRKKIIELLLSIIIRPFKG